MNRRWLQPADDEIQLLRLNVPEAASVLNALTVESTQCGTPPDSASVGVARTWMATGEIVRRHSCELKLLW